MSARIRDIRGDYDRVLEQTQHATMDVRSWMEWFIACLTAAIATAQTALADVIDTARYWETMNDVPLNERQRSDPEAARRM